MYQLPIDIANIRVIFSILYAAHFPVPYHFLSLAIFKKETVYFYRFVLMFIFLHDRRNMTIICCDSRVRVGNAVTVYFSMNQYLRVPRISCFVQVFEFS